MAHGSCHRMAEGQGSALLRGAGFFVAGHPPFHSSLIERAVGWAPRGRSLDNPLFARRWSARLSASSASQIGRRASLPYRGVPCH